MIKSSKGFTLVELIIVIAILAILAGIAIPAYTGYLKKADQAADNSILSAVYTAAAAAVALDGEVTSITVTPNATTGTVESITVVTDGSHQFNYTAASTTGGTTTPASWSCGSCSDDCPYENDFELFLGTTAINMKYYKADVTWTAADGWQ